MQSPEVKKQKQRDLFSVAYKSHMRLNKLFLVLNN